MEKSKHLRGTQKKSDHVRPLRGIEMRVANFLERLESRALLSAAPIVTTQPTINVFAPIGQNATFTAAATGDPTPTVQWEVSQDGVTDFAPITDNASATTTTLVIPNVQIGQEFNQYEAVFSNSEGTVASNTSTLYVEEAPIVTAQPSSEVLPSAGHTATFTAVATSPTTPQVQWYVQPAGASNFTPVTDNATATTPTLSLSHTAASASGSKYEAIFTNAAGSTSTEPVTLSVKATATSTPVASLTASTLKKSTTAYYFEVTYSDSVAIDTSTFDKHDVFVTGPNGFEESATFTGFTSSSGDKTVTATYRIKSEGAAWTSSDNGSYHVYVRAHQVKDLDGSYIAGGILGPFKAALA